MIQDSINNLKKNIKNNITNGELIKKSSEDNYYLNKVKQSKHLSNIKDEYERIYDQVANDPDTKEHLRLRFKKLYDELNRNKINTLLYSTPQAIELENEMQGKAELVDDEIKMMKKKKKDELKEDLKKLRAIPDKIDEINDYEDKYNEMKHLETIKPITRAYKTVNRKIPKNKDDYVKKINKLNNQISYLNSL